MCEAYQKITNKSDLRTEDRSAGSHFKDRDKEKKHHKKKTVTAQGIETMLNNTIKNIY